MAEPATGAARSLVRRGPDSAASLRGSGSATTTTKTKTTTTPPPTQAQKTADAPSANGAAKRKQTKSRNGCITCKAKRLKCDETKLACMQCARRGVVCGGYKKDFKWRPFEESNLSSKPAAKPRKRTVDTPVSVSVPTPVSTPIHAHHEHNAVQHPYRGHHAYPPAPSPSPFRFLHIPPAQPAFSHTSFLSDRLCTVPQPSPFFIPPPPISPAHSLAPEFLPSYNLLGTDNGQTRHEDDTAPPSIVSGQSPLLRDLLIPGTDMSVPPEEYSSFLSQHEAFYQPTGLTPPAPMDGEDEEVEEITRNGNVGPEAWSMLLPSPTVSRSTESSANTPEFKMLAQPQFAQTSLESLTRRYHRDTCGVLSVKDGPTENPWRTLVWPLARDCPALYHAIASMTSFHHSKDSPVMRVQGIHHMHTALNALLTGMKNMRSDAAISTTLVLVFAESWDQHIRTGYNHIKGAKVMINDALVEHRRNPKQGDEWTRLKFLCKTWIYMDVIARLTSADDDDESNDVDAIHEAIYAAGEKETAVDPLMGCAHTLFPIIGRVANLVRKVRRANGNGPSIISHAMQLKSQLDDWTPPSFIEDPEDETTSPHDSIKTAAAYRSATLLYLHQAVPEIPSPSSTVLAKNVLCELATVEPRSRSIIVHIYPLMAAGCEAVDQEDRNWVIDRWTVMAARMKLGIIDRGLEVTKEVWSRRDAYETEHKAHTALIRAGSYTPNAPLKRDFYSYFDGLETDEGGNSPESMPKRRLLDSMNEIASLPYAGNGEAPHRGQDLTRCVESLEKEFTVKGRLHWLGVMKDWEWEVLLG